MRNKLSFVRRVIYKMKRSYGMPITYHQILPDSHAIDPSTGAKINAYRAINIKRAIVLRAREFRSFVYDLAYISANKDFTTGAFFDPEDRKVIIDGKDVPATFNPNPEDFIVFKASQYNVSEVYSIEDGYSWMFLARRIRGAPVTRVESRMSVMDITQAVSYTIDDALTRSVVSELNLTDSLIEVP